MLPVATSPTGPLDVGRLGRASAASDIKALRMPPGRTVIASCRLLAIDAKGRESEITIALGQPCQISEHEWACPASMEGLHRLPDVRGHDSWQALQLAYELIARLLVYFVEDGGQLLDPEERSPVTPEELFPQLAVANRQGMEPRRPAR